VPRQVSSPDTSLPPAEKPPLTAGRGASQDRPQTFEEGVSCLGKAKVAVRRRERACGGYWMRHSATGVIVPARCNSHLCLDCSPLHQMTARRAFEKGLLQRIGEKRCETVVFLTLTDTAKGDLDLPGLAQKWQATRKRLCRMWGAGDYAMCVEFQDRGALHPHVCLEVDPQVASDLRERSTRASYRRRMHELRPAAESLGWGQLVDAQTVGVMESDKVARYAAKSLAGYTTKQAKERFKKAGAKHVRPVRLSYGWIEGGLAGAREDVLGRDAMAEGKIAGTWERIRSVAC
jgi:hypothetical protein